jgi:hypothetical protein
MIAEHDLVVLTGPLADHDLQAGDVGTVVHIHRAGEAFEVEFATMQGSTVAVVTVQAALLRAVSNRDLFHVREVEPA